MGRYQIIAVRKPDRNSPHEHITHLQIASGRIYTREDIISFIRGGDSFYTVDPRRPGKIADVEIVRPIDRSPYLQTRADGDLNDNLLHLPPC